MPDILIVDDDRDFQEAQKQILESRGLDVTSAYTVEEAKRMIAESDPDLVILDVMLPEDLEGFELARWVREELGDRRLPIIILTAVHQRTAVPYRFGPDDEWVPVDVFLDKPVKPDMLVARVLELVGEGPRPGSEPVEHL